MPEIGDTFVRQENGFAEESTAYGALPSIDLDRYAIRSLWATAVPAASTGHRDGIIGEQNRVHTGASTQSSPESLRGKPFSLFPPRVSDVPTATLHPTQKWEGRVIEIRDDEFDARLLDLTAGNDVDREVATIPLREVGAEDRALMHVDSIFHWVIGYERTVGGARRCVSRIVFLDPPRLTKRDCEKGRKWAEWLREEWAVE